MLKRCMNVDKRDTLMRPHFHGSDPEVVSSVVNNWVPLCDQVCWSLGTTSISAFSINFLATVKLSHNINICFFDNHLVCDKVVQLFGDSEASKLRFCIRSFTPIMSLFTKHGSIKQVQIGCLSGPACVMIQVCYLWILLCRWIWGLC